MAKFDWTYDEVVLAADLVVQNDWKGVRAHDPRVIDLSDLLRSASIHPEGDRPSNFRSPNSVQRKTFDIATRHPSYKGVQTKGGKIDARVTEEFLRNPERAVQLARQIQAQLRSEAMQEPIADPDLETLSAHEGMISAAQHLRRERSPKLRRAKLSAVMAASRTISCEVCGFDFSAQYGTLGNGYIEVHHVLPLHASGPVQTHLKDLALLCSNCHRMIHRARPWLTPSELRKRLQS